jgi:hypothetical protein
MQSSPAEIHTSIAHYLIPRDAVHLASSCRRIYTSIYHSDLVWRKAYHNHWPAWDASWGTQDPSLFNTCQTWKGRCALRSRTEHAWKQGPDESRAVFRDNVKGRVVDKIRPARHVTLISVADHVHNWCIYLLDHATNQMRLFLNARNAQTRKPSVIVCTETTVVIIAERDQTDYKVYFHTLFPSGEMKTYEQNRLLAGFSAESGVLYAIDRATLMRWKIPTSPDQDYIPLGTVDYVYSYLFVSSKQMATWFTYHSQNTIWKRVDVTKPVPVVLGECRVLSSLRVTKIWTDEFLCVACGQDNERGAIEFVAYSALDDQGIKWRKAIAVGETVCDFIGFDDIACHVVAYSDGSYVKRVSEGEERLYKRVVVRGYVNGLKREEDVEQFAWEHHVVDMDGASDFVMLDRVTLTTALVWTDLQAVAFDVTNGKELWRHEAKERLMVNVDCLRLIVLVDDQLCLYDMSIRRPHTAALE